MTKRREIESVDHGAEGLALAAKRLGYGTRFEQLMFNNGASATNLIEFFDDNPGACEAVLEWILEHGCDSDGNPLDDEGNEDEDEDEDEESEED